MKKLKYTNPTKVLLARIRGKKNEVSASKKSLHQMPGSLIYTGDETFDIRLEVIQFNQEEFLEYELENLSLENIKEHSGVLWLNVLGLHDASLIKRVGDRFSLHNLALEDIMNVHHRPNFDQFDDNFLISFKMLHLHEGELDWEQLSFVVGQNYILTFQEKPGDVFEGVRSRLRKKKGRIRSRGSDYLAFALLDVIVDQYLAILANYDEEINEQEIKLVENANKEILTEINSSKKQINHLRKLARPLREAIHGFSRCSLSIIEKRTRPFIKDLLDHIDHVNESIELNRETIQDNLNNYHSQMSSKLNDILKVLTIFSVIFIPLTFMAGIYGMNFDYIPELRYKYSYPIFWGVLLSIAGGMLLYFKKRRWL